MSEFFVVVVLPLVILLTLVLAAVVHRDGYGTRTPPRGERDWADGIDAARVR